MNESKLLDNFFVINSIALIFLVVYHLLYLFGFVEFMTTTMKVLSGVLILLYAIQSSLARKRWRKEDYKEDLKL